MNHFMARLIFCFFAEDTRIFAISLFTETVERMSDKQSENTTIISKIFSAMNNKNNQREALDLRHGQLIFHT